MDKLANISHENFRSYTGTIIPTNYIFICWVNDENEDKLINDELNMGNSIIQIIIPSI